MKITYEPFTSQFIVNGIPFREFYIAARKEANISIGALEAKAGVTHPILVYLEKGQSGKKQSNSIRAMLIAMEALGYEVTIRKVS